MKNSQLQQLIELGLKTSKEIGDFRSLTAYHSEDEAIKIIIMQRG